MLRKTGSAPWSVNSILSAAFDRKEEKKKFSPVPSSINEDKTGIEFERIEFE